MRRCNIFVQHRIFSGRKLHDNPGQRDIKEDTVGHGARRSPPAPKSKGSKPGTSKNCTLQRTLVTIRFSRILTRCCLLPLQCDRYWAYWAENKKQKRVPEAGHQIIRGLNFSRSGLIRLPSLTAAVTCHCQLLIQRLRITFPTSLVHSPLATLQQR